jgi:hypothetical protein
MRMPQRNSKPSFAHRSYFKMPQQTNKQPSKRKANFHHWSEKEFGWNSFYDENSHYVHKTLKLNK